MSSSGDEVNSKRQRVSRACDHCRKKKIKCDGNSPVCSNCQMFDLECTYKDTTKKRGPPKGYIEAIENRLHKIEAYLNQAAKKDDSSLQILDLLREIQSPLEISGGITINGRPHRRQRRKQSIQNDTIQNNFDPNPVSPLIDSPSMMHTDLADQDSSHLKGFSLLETDTKTTPGSISVDEHGQMRYLGDSSGFHLLSDSRTYKDGVFHFSGYYHQLPSEAGTDRRHHHFQHLSDKMNALDFPSKDLSDHLIELYLEHFYPVLPMFYKKSIVSCSNSLDSVSPLLLNAIYAIASRISPDAQTRSTPSLPETAGHVFYERARCLLDDYYDTPKISTIQALLLMASYQMGAMKPAKAWLYSGMAFRMAHDLGLNRNCNQWNITIDEQERRKRVFWCCYIVDRLMSAIYGRQYNFDESDCDTPFPSIDDDESIYSSDPSRSPIRLLDLLNQSIKMSNLLGCVLKNIYYVKAKYRTDSQQANHILTVLHRQLIQWHTDLPFSLQYKVPDTRKGENLPNPHLAICQLHLMYQTTLILLHRSFIPEPKLSYLPLVSTPSYTICETAANSVLDIVHNMMSNNSLRFASHYTVFYMFTAGIIFVKLASSNDARVSFDAKVNINRIMKALDNIETTWMNASRSSNILGELAGLRDIRLENNKYIPEKTENLEPPPSINVPNSPNIDCFNEDYNNGEYYDTGDGQLNASLIGENSNSILSSNDGTILSMSESQTILSKIDFLGALSKTIDLSIESKTEFNNLGPAFWSAPASLNMNDWHIYFNQVQQKNKTEATSSTIDMHSVIPSVSGYEDSMNHNLRKRPEDE